MEAAIAWILEAEERIGELEDKIMEKEEAEKKRGEIRKLSDAVKLNICIIGIPEEEEREKGAEDVLEQIIVERRKQALKSKRHRELPSDVT